MSLEKTHKELFVANLDKPYSSLEGGKWIKADWFRNWLKSDKSITAKGLKGKILKEIKNQWNL